MIGMLIRERNHKHVDLTFFGKHKVTLERQLIKVQLSPTSFVLLNEEDAAEIARVLKEKQEQD